MQKFSTARFFPDAFSGAILLVLLCGAQPASAQSAAAPAKPVAAPAPRGADIGGAQSEFGCGCSDTHHSDGQCITPRDEYMEAAAGIEPA